MIKTIGKLIGGSFLTVLLVTTSLKGALPTPDDFVLPLQVISFGGCNKHDLSQPLWDHILKHNSDLWIWNGDNIYAKTEDMKVMRAIYNSQKNNEGYKKLLNSVPVIGIWDDHDYGAHNDGGKANPKRKESQKEFLDFFDVPQDSPRRQQEGIYTSYIFGPPGSRTKIFLLDTRYHMDEYDKKGFPPPDGDILGEAQWGWLENEMRNSDADLNIFVSGIHVLGETGTSEKWARFPKSLLRLYKLLAESKVNAPILISGDRHSGEIGRKEDVEELGFPLYEITSSGLTHHCDPSKSGHYNSDSSLKCDNGSKYRLGNLFLGINFGLIKISWEDRKLTMEIRDENNDVQLLQDVLLSNITTDKPVSMRGTGN